MGSNADLSPRRSWGTGQQMTPATENTVRRRNKGFDETHAALIEVAVRLISEKGADALSIAALARAAGVNRTTVYYHFATREDLIASVRDWSAHQLSRAFEPVAPAPARTEFITRFVIDNPELIGMWIDEFVAPGDIRARYPEWDRLVAGMDAHFGASEGGETIDPEVFSTILLTVAFIAPRIFHLSVRPDLGPDEARRRFLAEQLRMLRRDGIGS
jgi:AcrR family transcriptional regulator